MPYHGMVRHKAVVERYAALRCLWHGVRVEKGYQRTEECAHMRVARPALSALHLSEPLSV
eukprot:2837337-Prymnesium_polylepis.1